MFDVYVDTFKHVKIGDELIIEINNGTQDNQVLEQIKIQVIGKGNGGDKSQCICYVPPYQIMKHSFKLTIGHQKHYKFDNKFLNEFATFITSQTKIIKHMPTMGGETCDHCKIFFEYAEPNDENRGFLCYQCKQDPWR